MSVGDGHSNDHNRLAFCCNCRNIKTVGVETTMMRRGCLPLAASYSSYGFRWQSGSSSDKGDSTASQRVKVGSVKKPAASHYGFAGGKAPKSAPVGQTQRKPAPSSAHDPRSKADSRVFYDPSGKTQQFESSRLDDIQKDANRKFNKLAADEPWMYYIRDNLNGLMLYQLLLEQSLTLLFMVLIGLSVLTPEAVEELVRTVLFGHDIGLTTHSVWEEDVYLLGSAEKRHDGHSVCLPKEWLTLYSQGHQISWYLMPLQCLFVFKTYESVRGIARFLPTEKMFERVEKSERLYKAKQKGIRPPGNIDAI